jgi:hypothetical protein
VLLNTAYNTLAHGKRRESYDYRYPKAGRFVMEPYDWEIPDCSGNQFSRYIQASIRNTKKHMYAGLQICITSIRNIAALVLKIVKRSRSLNGKYP